MTLVVDPELVSTSAGIDTAAAGMVGAATLGATPVMSAVLPPGVDSTSVMAQQMVLAHAVSALQMLGQFTGQRMLFAAAKDLSAGVFSATEAANAAAAALGV
ncbi:PE domain-containing protein [Mycobacterium haemophilum]